MPQMSFELFVALRYLFSRRKQTFIYIISLMSILGVAIGVGALVVVLGVYNGLTTDMRDKILGANAHAIVMSYVPSAFEHDQDLTQRIRSVDGVTGATPFIYTEVMLSAGGGVKGVVLRGIDPASAPEVLSLLHQMRSGSPEDLQKEGTPGIIIGEELARRLGLAVGSICSPLQARRPPPAIPRASGLLRSWASSRPACSSTIPPWLSSP